MPILLELRRGIGEPEQVPLSVGQQLSVGRRGMWRVEGPKVLDIHGYFYYDGVTLFVMSETDAEPVLVNRKEMSMEWTPVRGPCEISMGGVVLSFVGSIGQEDSGVTLARVPPPSRKEMADLDNAPTSHTGGGATIPRATPQQNPPPAPSPAQKPGPHVPAAKPSVPAARGSAPGAKPSVPAPRGSAPGAKPSVPAPKPSKPEYVEPPAQARDLDGTSGVTHVRPETLERLAADHQEAIAAAAVPRMRPPQPSPVPQQPPSGATRVLPEGAVPPAPRPITAPPPQAQAPDAGRKNEGSGATRFAPLEAPSGASLDVNALHTSGVNAHHVSGANAAAHGPQLSGAHFASSGPPALYAHQTSQPFAPGQPQQPGAAPWHGHPGVPPASPSAPGTPGAPPAPGTQDPTAMKLSFGARLRRDWAATSLPRKALVFLAPALAWVLLSDDPEDLVPGKGAATAKPTATATGAAATSAPTVITPSTAPASTLAIIPAPMPTLTATGKGATPPAPVGTAKVVLSTERKAIDALSMGQEAEALKYYDELAKDHPDNPNFKEAARILRKRHELPLPK